LTSWELYENDYIETSVPFPSIIGTEHSVPLLSNSEIIVDTTDARRCKLKNYDKSPKELREISKKPVFDYTSDKKFKFRSRYSETVEVIPSFLFSKPFVYQILFTIDSEYENSKLVLSFILFDKEYLIKFVILQKIYEKKKIHFTIKFRFETNSFKNSKQHFRLCLYLEDRIYKRIIFESGKFEVFARKTKKILSKYLINSSQKIQ